MYKKPCCVVTSFIWRPSSVKVFEMAAYVFFSNGKWWKPRDSNLLMRQIFLKEIFFSRLIRPVGNSTDRLTVKMGLKLSQIIGVDMKRQILITNVWVEQVCILLYFEILLIFKILWMHTIYMFFFRIGMARLQIKMESSRLWKCSTFACTFTTYMVTRYCLV